MMRVIAGILGASFLFSLWIVLPPIEDWRWPGSAASDTVQVTRNADIAGAGEEGTAAFIMTDGTTLEASTDHVLQALGIIPEVADSSLSPFEMLVVDLLRQGLSDEEIDAAVNDAAARGEITVPAELVTPEARVETVRLLAAVDAGARAALVE
jgi:hypothetical protein